MQESQAKNSKFFSKIHEFCVFPLNRFRHLMEFGFFFREAKSVQNLASKKEELLLEYQDKNKSSAREWEIIKGLFALEYIQIHQNIGKKFINIYGEGIRSKERSEMISKDLKLSQKLEGVLEKLSQQSKNDIMADETLIMEYNTLEAVLLIFKMRMLCRNQNLGAILQIFEMNLELLKELIKQPNISWIIISFIFTAIALCRRYTKDHKGSAIIFRKAIKMIAKMLQLEIFSDICLSIPKKRVKIIELLYFCELKLQKDVFQVANKSKESFKLQLFVMRIKADKWLNLQQKETLIQKFEKEYHKQVDHIVKQKSCTQVSEFMQDPSNNFSHTQNLDNTMAQGIKLFNQETDLDKSKQKPYRAYQQNDIVNSRPFLQRTPSLNINNSALSATSSKVGETLPQKLLKTQVSKRKSIFGIFAQDEDKKQLKLKRNSSTAQHKSEKDSEISKSLVQQEEFYQEDLSNNNFSEFSIALPNDNESFIERYQQKKGDEEKQQQVESVIKDDRIEISKQLLLERIKLFKHRKGLSVFDPKLAESSSRQISPNHIQNERKPSPNKKEEKSKKSSSMHSLVSNFSYTQVMSNNFVSKQSTQSKQLDLTLALKSNKLYSGQSVLSSINNSKQPSPVHYNSNTSRIQQFNTNLFFKPQTHRDTKLSSQQSQQLLQMKVNQADIKINNNRLSSASRQTQPSTTQFRQDSSIQMQQHSKRPSSPLKQRQISSQYQSSHEKSTAQDQSIKKQRPLSQELSSCYSEKTTDSRVEYKMIDAFKKEEMMSARPKLESQQQLNNQESYIIAKEEMIPPKSRENSFNKIKQASKLIDLLIEQSAIKTDTYPNPLEKTGPFPNIKEVLNNIEQEKMMKEMNNRSQKGNLVAEINKKKVKEILFNKQRKGTIQTNQFRNSISQFSNQLDTIISDSNGGERDQSYRTSQNMGVEQQLNRYLINQNITNYNQQMQGFQQKQTINSLQTNALPNPIISNPILQIDENSIKVENQISSNSRINANESARRSSQIQKEGKKQDELPKKSRSRSFSSSQLSDSRNSQNISIENVKQNLFSQQDIQKKDKISGQKNFNFQGAEINKQNSNFPQVHLIKPGIFSEQEKSPSNLQTGNRKLTDQLHLKLDQVLWSPKAKENSKKSNKKWIGIHQIVKTKLQLKRFRGLSQADINNIFNPLSKVEIAFVQSQSSIPEKVEKYYPQIKYLQSLIKRPTFFTVSFEKTKNSDFQIQIQAKNIFVKIPLEFKFQGSQDLSTQINSASVWSFVLLSLKQQMKKMKLGQLVSEEILNEGQFMQDNSFVVDHKDSSNKDSSNNSQLHLQLPSPNEISLPNETRKHYRKTSVLVSKQKEWKIGDCSMNMSKSVKRILKEEDLKSIGSIKNILSGWMSYCYHEVKKENGFNYVAMHKQEEINFLHLKRTVTNQASKLLKIISQMSVSQTRKNIAINSTSRSRGWGVLITINYQVKNEIVNINKNSRNYKLNKKKIMDIQLNEDETKALSDWQQQQDSLAEKIKVKQKLLIQILSSSKQDLITSLEKQLQAQTLIGVMLVKTQASGTKFFLLSIYLTINKQTTLNQQIFSLSDIFDKFCQVKSSSPFSLIIQAKDMTSFESTLPYEISLEQLSVIILQCQLQNELTRLFLNGKMNNRFLKFLFKILANKVVIVKSIQAFTKNTRNAKDFRQFKLFFKTFEVEEQRQTEDDINTLPQIFQDRIKDAARYSTSSLAAEDLFEGAFNHIYEKNFRNKKNADIESLFEKMISQQSEKQQLLREYDEEGSDHEGVEEQQEEEEDNQQVIHTSPKNNTKSGSGVENPPNSEKVPENKMQSIVSDDSLKGQEAPRNHGQKNRGSEFLTFTQLVPCQNSSSLESSFVSNIQAQYPKRTSSLQMYSSREIFKRKPRITVILFEVKGVLRMCTLKVNWQNVGFKGKFFISENMEGELDVNLISLQNRKVFYLIGMTESQKKIFQNALQLFQDKQKMILKTHDVDFKCKKLFLSNQLQNLTQFNTKSLQTEEIELKKIIEQSNQQLILQNNLSIQYHLNLQTNEFKSYYSQIIRSFPFRLASLGRCLITASCYLINKQELNDKYPIVFHIQIFPQYSKTKAQKAIFSAQDLNNIDPFLAKKMQSGIVSPNLISSCFQIILKNLTPIQTPIGKLSIFHYETIQNNHGELLLNHKIRQDSAKQKSYESRLLSGLIKRSSERIKNLQNKTPEKIEQNSSRSIKFSPDAGTKIDEQDDISQWIDHVNGLRCFKNGLSKMNFDQKVLENTSHNFLNEDVIRYRQIFSSPKTLDNEFIIVTVYRDLLLQNWLIKFYFPRNCRTLQCHIDQSDMFQSSSKFLKKTISLQIIWLLEYEYTTSFKNYLELNKRLDIQVTPSPETTFKNKTEKLSPSHGIQVMRAIIRKKTNLETFTSSPQNKKSLLKMSVIREQVNSIAARPKPNQLLLNEDEEGVRIKSMRSFNPFPNHSHSPSPTYKSKQEIQLSPFINPMSRFYAEKKASESSKNIKLGDIFSQESTESIHLPNFRNQRSQQEIQKKKSEKSKQQNDIQEIDLFNFHSTQKEKSGFQDYVKDYTKTEIAFKKNQKQQTQIISSTQIESPQEQKLLQLRQELMNGLKANKASPNYVKHTTPILTPNRNRRNTYVPQFFGSGDPDHYEEMINEDLKLQKSNFSMSTGSDKFIQGRNEKQLNVKFNERTPNKKKIEFPNSSKKKSFEQNQNNYYIQNGENQLQQRRQSIILQNSIRESHQMSNDSIQSTRSLKVEDANRQKSQASQSNNFLSVPKKRPNSILIHQRSSLDVNAQSEGTIIFPKQENNNINDSVSVTKEVLKIPLSTQKPEKPHSMANRLKDIIKKHIRGTTIMNSVKKIVQYFKPTKYDKIQKIEKLKNLTLLQDNLFYEMMKKDQNGKNIRQESDQRKNLKNEQFFEQKIWENMISFIELKHTCLQVDFGGQGLNLKEQLVSKYLRIDKQNENFIEISIDLLESMQKKNMQIQMQTKGVIQDFEINFKNLLSSFLEQQQQKKEDQKLEKQKIEIIKALENEQKEITLSISQSNVEEIKESTSSINRERLNSLKESLTLEEKYQSLKKSQKLKIRYSSKASIPNLDLPSLVSSSSDGAAAGGGSETEGRMKVSRVKKTGVNYFYPIEQIQYAATSQFNFTISHMNLNSATVQDIYLNCREITNVFIAEGYFKYQANYIYSNINYSDLCNLALFILYKIKSSNFLEMLYDKSAQKKIKNEDINKLSRRVIPPKYDKKNIRFINPQNIIYLYTKTIDITKRTYLRASMSTHDLVFNLEIVQITTKFTFKIQKTFTHMLKIIPFMKEHFEMGQISTILRQVSQHYEKKLIISWLLKYDQDSSPLKFQQRV